MQTRNSQPISSGKVCTVCNGNTPPFVKGSGKCSLCRGEYYKQYRARNLDIISSKQKIRYQQNKDRNREAINKRHREEHIKIREEVFAAYGHKCNCCGENNSAFLTIDHIEGDGSQHRKKIRMSIYRWLKRNGFPKNNFQILCFNCNCAKQHRSNGTCPHGDQKI